jgi:RNA polymerase sigma-70 factor (ECF subfamily)
MDELTIITAVRDGEIERYAELVERYRIGLIIYCERLVGDRDEAEDVAQQAFIKAYSQLKSFDAQKGRFSTWLYRIAYNQAIDLLRQSKRVQLADTEEDFGSMTPDTLRQELIQEVREAVQELKPPEQRMAVEAYYWQGKSCQLIADEAGVSVNTVKSWLRRAKIQLRGKMS